MDYLDILKILIGQALVTAFAAFLGYLKIRQSLSRFRSEKVYETKLDRTKRQLSELYGPIYMRVKSNQRIFDTCWGTDIWPDVWRTTLAPSNSEIEGILVANVHLVDEFPIPESFFDFVTHAHIAGQYLESGLNKSYFEKEQFYPKNFIRDIEISYRKKREEYIELLDLQLRKSDDPPVSWGPA